MPHSRRNGRQRDRDRRRRHEGNRGRDSTRASERSQPQQNRSNRSTPQVPAPQSGPTQASASSTHCGACSQPPTTFPNNTAAANRNAGPQEEEGPKPTAEDAMSEVKFLRIIIQAQQDRIEKLEQKEKRTADVLGALTKLALETAQNTGYVNDVSLREFGAAIGDV